MNIATSFVEYMHENIDPDYAEEKEKIKTFFQTAQLISTAFLTASVAFAIFAFVSIASGGFIGLGGMIMFTASLSMGYFSYNSYRIAENIDHIFDNPKAYQNLFGLKETFNRRAFKQKISEGTYSFNWFTSHLTNELMKLGIVEN